MLNGYIGQNFLPDRKKFTLIHHWTIYKYEENNPYDQLLHLNDISSHLFEHKQ
jgi:hypothetical protein